MDLDSGWLSLADTVGRLVARGVQEGKAKVDICQELARAEWSPCQATADALGSLAGRETISLFEAVSIMALEAQAEFSDGGKRE